MARRGRPCWPPAGGVGLLGGGVGGCPGPQGLVPPVPPTVVLQTSTTAPDLSGVGLPGVSGRTTTTSIPLGPGGAALNGTVTGPDGALGGATVPLQRLAADGLGSADMISPPHG